MYNVSGKKRVYKFKLEEEGIFDLRFLGNSSMCRMNLFDANRVVAFAKIKRSLWRMIKGPVLKYLSGFMNFQSSKIATIWRNLKRLFFFFNPDFSNRDG